jgi:hypothetical protein
MEKDITTLGAAQAKRQRKLARFDTPATRQAAAGTRWLSDHWGAPYWLPAVPADSPPEPARASHFIS